MLSVVNKINHKTHFISLSRLPEAILSKKMMMIYFTLHNM